MKGGIQFRRLRIGINTRLLLTHRMEGIARYTWEISKRMILANPQDQFYLFFDRPYDEQFLIAENVHAVHVFPPSRHPILWKIWFDRSMAKALRKHRIDVFFSPDGFTSMTTEVPQLLVIHDLTYLHYPASMKRGHLSYYQKMMPLFYKKADRIVAVSKTTRDDIVAHFGRKPDQEIAVAYNALPEQKPYPSRSIISEDYILYLGSIHPRKNIIRLIQAYNDFREKQPSKRIKLVLAGRKAFGNDTLDTVLEQLRFKEDIIFLGAVDEETKYNLLQQARLFVYVSLFEGFGIPLLEAMAAGIPIVHSDDPALMEVGNKIGKVAKSTDVNDISSAIVDALTDEDWRRQAVKDGKDRMADFSWDESASKIYQEIAKLNKSN